MQTPIEPRQVTASVIEHRGAQQIALNFPFDERIKDHLKKLDGITWSQTHQCLYLARARGIAIDTAFEAAKQGAPLATPAMRDGRICVK